MKKSRISMLLLSLSVSASMLLTACGGETATSTPATTGGGSTGAATATTATGGSTSGGSGGTVKIAVDLPVSGADASDGIPTRNGVQLAIDQANKAGGVTIDGKPTQLQMFFLDDVPPGGSAHDPAQGAKNADAFIADPDVVVMIGPFNSSVAKAMMPKLNQGNLAHISPANTNETLTKPQYGVTKDLRPTGKVTYFRVCATDDIQGPAAADFAYDKLGKKKMYILDDTETYGKGLADNVEKEFKTKGGTVLGHDGVPKGTTDFSSILTKAAQQSPDVLFYGGTSSTGIPVARKQMKAAGLDIPLLGGDGIINDEYLKTGGADAEGSYGTLAAVNATTLPEAKQFLADYKAAFNAEVGSYSANAYEATNIAIAAIKTAGKKDREAVRAALAATKDFKGVIGTTTFDENGDTTNRWISIYQVKGGKWEFIDQLKIGQ
jgi:branched-chain amino acid transport system substrate-binding protein